jgi:hypothetical protein
MKRHIIAILFVAWAFCLIGLFAIVTFYIDRKRDRLHAEIKDNITKLFEGQSSGDAFVSNDDGLFFEDYSGQPVRHYKRISIPKRPGKSSFAAKIDPKIDEKIQDDWYKSYGDLASLYELNWGDEYPNGNDEGWNIVRIYCWSDDDDFIQTNTFFPYKVGLKNTDWGNYYSVERAVNEAFDFYSNNPKSGISNRFRKETIDQFWSKIYACCNSYFTISENKHVNGWTTGTPIYIPKGKKYEEAQRVLPYENGWMQNGFYRVFIAATQEKHFMIKEYEWAASSDKKKFLLWYGIGLSAFFLSVIIPLTIKKYKSKQRKGEDTYHRLLRKCNPKEFMKDYDKDKVEKANNIYARILETSPEDTKTLLEILDIVSSELGVTLVDKDELDELKEKVNPRNFTNPYNAEKVSLANELYSKLEQKNLTYKDFLEVKEKAELL